MPVEGLICEERMLLTTDDVLKATGGKLLRGREGLRFTGVSIDSRTIRGGELFVAIKGEHFDGHDFSEAALQMGALGRVVREGWEPAVLDPMYESSSEASLITVPDTLRALQDLAQFHRMQFSIPLVAVTGTNGKTSTKEMIYSILSLRYKTQRSVGNLNNHIGVPLSLFGLDPGTEAAVLEFGMSGFGEIARLREIARPTVAVITNVSSAHLMTLKNEEEIARAKGEILEGLPREGWAILNRDDVRVYSLRKGVKAGVITFGFAEGADVRADRVETDSNGEARFILSYKENSVPVQLPRPGRHQIANALAAAAATLAMGMSLGEISEGLSACRLPSMRWETVRLSSGAEVINDAYNANPASVTAALRTLGSPAEGRRNIAVLGDMLELGSASEELHRKIGRSIVREGIVSLLVTVGKQAAFIADEAVRNGMRPGDVIRCTDVSEAAEKLSPILRANDRVLLKASRGMGLERILEGLKNAG